MERAGVGLSSPALRVPSGSFRVGLRGRCRAPGSGLHCTPAKSLLCVNKEITLFSLKG